MGRFKAMLALRAVAVAMLVTVPVAVPGGMALAAVTELATGEQNVVLEVHKGKLLRLPRAAASVFVADPAFADVTVRSPTLVYVTAKRAGETSLFAVDDAERVLADVTLTIRHNISALAASVLAIVPAGAINVSSDGGSLVVGGAVGSAAEARQVARLAQEFVAEGEEVINQLALIGPNQVNLRVRVAEIQRKVVKRFGFNFDIAPTIGSITFGVAQGIVNPIALGIDQPFNVSGVFNSGSLDANILIDALEKEGLVTVLAEPNLTALSGETASFLAGGEFPVLVPDNDGIALEFKEFGVSLSFTPTIINGGRISMRVAPEVSELSTAGAIEIQGFTIPAITTRRAETTVELGSGQSIAIAGLLKSDTVQELQEFPGLADIPVLGALFRKSELNTEDTELVIIATPYLVRPVDAVAMATPLDGFEPASDVDRYLNGRTYKPQVPSAERGPRSTASRGLAGPVGFELN